MKRLARMIRRSLSGSPQRYWGTILIALAAAIAIIFFRQEQQFHFINNTQLFPLPQHWSSLALVAASSVGLLCFAPLAIGSLFGDTEFRRLRSLGVFIALLACCLGFVMNCRNIAWQGRRLSVSPYVDYVDEYATPLLDDWPREDGELVGIGPFMAYPVGKPRTLILLTPPPLFENGPAIRAIERSDGAVRFELSDQEGEWIEYRTTGPPESHVGGLWEQRKLVRYSSLSGNWFLVRYEDRG